MANSAQHNSEVRWLREKLRQKGFAWSRQFNDQRKTMDRTKLFDVRKEINEMITCPICKEIFPSGKTEKKWLEPTDQAILESIIQHEINFLGSNLTFEVTVAEYYSRNWSSIVFKQPKCNNHELEREAAEEQSKEYFDRYIAGDR